MFDQSFSAANFRKLFDYANRKGVYLEGRFFPELEPITAELKTCAANIRELRRNKQLEQEQGTYDDKLARLYSLRAELKQTKDARLATLLEQASAEVAQPTFTLGLQQGHSSHGKPVFTSGASAASYLALQQLQRNIRHLYRVKQTNRHQILCQLRELLRDGFPKIVIRLDFTGFYESIPRDKLLRKLANDSLLTVASKRLITQLLWEYGSGYNAPTGLPRGIGISAYLSELYMRSFDDAIRNTPGVIYYARYVDDIVLVFVPSPNSTHRAMFRTINSHICAHGLKRNRHKSEVFHVDGQTPHTLDFLGYSFSFGNGTIQLSLTTSKLNKYKTRIRRSFEAYRNTPGPLKLGAQRLLIRRLRFLTGNTRLLNNKRKAMVGVYFSNSLLTTEAPLRALDAYLQHCASSEPTHLQTRISSMSFAIGFATKRFYRYSAQDLSRIVKAWKYAT